MRHVTRRYIEHKKTRESTRITTFRNFVKVNERVLLAVDGPTAAGAPGAEREGGARDSRGIANFEEKWLAPPSTTISK